MHSTHRLKRIWGPVLAGVLGLLGIDCGGNFGQQLGQAGSAMCPTDINSVSAIHSASLGLEADLEARAKAALSAGARLQQIGASLEADVVQACRGLAIDLGVPESELAPKGNAASAQIDAACGAASRAVADHRAKLSARVVVKAEPPRCRSSAKVMADCAARCDADIEPGSAQIECKEGELSGRCKGECRGTCTVEGSADCRGSCSGRCTGKCQGEVTGQCEGTCEGTCEGQSGFKGKCQGTCQGKCTGGKLKGSCEGTCRGSCDAACRMDGRADCQGSCSGGCSVELEEPKCSGELEPPEMSAECEADCKAEVTAELECSPPSATVAVMGDADVASAQRLQAALEQHLPVFLRIVGSMQGRVDELSASVRASLDGMRATLEAAGTQGARVAGCFVASLQAQAQASVKIQASVKASASVSGKASGSI